MPTPTIVLPKAFDGFNFSPLQLIGKGPKFTVTCGNCGCNFQDRIAMVDYPCLKCPFCKAINKLPLVIEKMNYANDK